MTAAGATGMYTDQPADSAIYGAWLDATGEARIAKIEPSSSNALAPGLNVRSDGYRFVTTKVCAAGGCWTHTHIEWVDDPVGTSGSEGFAYGPGVPAQGGRAPATTGNRVSTDAKLRAAVDRGLTKAKEKLKNANCVALFNRLGVNGTTLMAVMQARHFDDPRAYLTTYLTYVSGGSKDCPGDAKASTKVGGATVAICPSFAILRSEWPACI